MQSRGDSPAGTIFVVFICIASLLGFWFHQSSVFLNSGKIDVSRRMFMPIACSITGDQIEDTRRSAQVYTWQGDVRIDLQSIRPEKYSDHEIIRGSGSAYAWRDGLAYGKKSSESILAPQLTQFPNLAGWLCYPWIWINFSTFTLPSSVNFE